MTIKPIETVYNGYKFRSRLEARWAVFFDAAGIKWEYRPKEIQFCDGMFQADFYLPSFDDGMFCVVRPQGGDFSAAYAFVKTSNKPIWLCEGLPEMLPHSFLQLYPPDIKVLDSLAGEKYKLACIRSREAYFDNELNYLKQR